MSHEPETFCGVLPLANLDPKTPNFYVLLTDQTLLRQTPSIEIFGSTEEAVTHLHRLHPAPHPHLTYLYPITDHYESTPLESRTIEAKIHEALRLAGHPDPPTSENLLPHWKHLYRYQSYDTNNNPKTFYRYRTWLVAPFPILSVHVDPSSLVPDIFNHSKTIIAHHQKLHDFPYRQRPSASIRYLTPFFPGCFMAKNQHWRKLPFITLDSSKTKNQASHLARKRERYVAWASKAPTFGFIHHDTTTALATVLHRFMSHLISRGRRLYSVPIRDGSVLTKKPPFSIPTYNRDRRLSTLTDLDNSLSQLSPRERRILRRLRSWQHALARFHPFLLGLIKGPTDPAYCLAGHHPRLYNEARKQPKDQMPWPANLRADIVYLLKHPHLQTEEFKQCRTNPPNPWLPSDPPPPAKST